MENTNSNHASELLRHTTEVISAYVSHNNISSDQLPELINLVYHHLSRLGSAAKDNSGEDPKPAVAIRRSVTHDYLICLEDGKKLKMLKRYLRTAYGLTPDEYRKKWGLPPDYPMVAPSYAARRSEFAKKIGLGKSGRS